MHLDSTARSVRHPSSTGELIDAIRIVAAGEALLAPRATQALLASIASGTTTASPETNPATAHSSLDVLTDREREIMGLVALGYSNDQIYLSPLTAKTHVNRAMMKLHVHDRAQLVALAYQPAS